MWVGPSDMSFVGTPNAAHQSTMAWAACLVAVYSKAKASSILNGHLEASKYTCCRHYEAQRLFNQIVVDRLLSGCRRKDLMAVVFSPLR